MSTVILVHILPDNGDIHRFKLNTKKKPHSAIILMRFRESSKGILTSSIGELGHPKNRYLVWGSAHVLHYKEELGQGGPIWSKCLRCPSLSTIYITPRWLFRQKKTKKRVINAIFRSRLWKGGNARMKLEQKPKNREGLALPYAWLYYIAPHLRTLGGRPRKEDSLWRWNSWPHVVCNVAV